MNNKHTTMSMMVHVMELVGKITYLFLVGKNVLILDSFLNMPFCSITQLTA